MLSSESRNEVVDYIMTESQLAGTFSWYSSESHIFNLTAGKYQYILVLSLTKKKDEIYVANNSFLNAEEKCLLSK